MLTLDRVILERFCDVMQKENEEVLLDAYLIAHFQTGLKNVLDRDVLIDHRYAPTFRFRDAPRVESSPFDTWERSTISGR
jgi:P-type Mg2+ transporter